MDRIAEWGYYVISRDRYHRAEPWYTAKSRSDEMKKMFGLVLGTSESDVAEDLRAVLAWLPSDPAARGEAMGCIGYCIGARSSRCTIRDRGDVFRAAAGLHPSFCTTGGPDSPHLAVSSYTGSLYIGFGSADTMPPASANAALIDATNALGKGEAEIHDAPTTASTCTAPPTTTPRRRGPMSASRPCSTENCRLDSGLRNTDDEYRARRSESG